MSNENISAALDVMNTRFGHDSLISVATVEDGKPFVRTVDALFSEGSFYTITYALSNKMRQIGANPVVAVCGEWFTGHGVGENLGYIRNENNKEIADKLRAAFAAWYSNGHTNEDDPNTVILRIKMTNGVLFAEGTRYDIDFADAFRG